MNAFEKYEDVEIRHMQVVYLANKGIAYAEICEITSYAHSTVCSYVYKYAYLLDEAKRQFKPECQYVYDLDEITYEKGTEQVYLMKFYDDRDELIFSKIGTTTRNVLTRAKEHVRYYTNHGFEIGMVTIDSVEDCKQYPAEMVESFLRFAFIKQYPNTWKKNDRFFGVSIDLVDFINEVEKCML